MQMTEGNMISDKIRGSILGGAIGDAMGGPLEGRPEGFAEQHYGGPVTELEPYLDRETFRPIPDRSPGDYTDDTRLKNILCSAIIERGGRITAEEFAVVWLRDMDPDMFYLTEKIAFYKLRFKRTIAREGGAGNVPACDADMMISPVGLKAQCVPGPEIVVVVTNLIDVGQAVTVYLKLVDGTLVAEVNPANVVDFIRHRFGNQYYSRAWGSVRTVEDPHAYFESKRVGRQLCIVLDPIIGITHSSVLKNPVPAHDPRRTVISPSG